jgi:hypothetical protein
MLLVIEHCGGCNFPPEKLGRFPFTVEYLKVRKTNYVDY